MQAITIAISPGGIEYFVKELIVNDLLTSLRNLGAPSRTIPIADFGLSQDGTDTYSYSHISIQLSEGRLNGFDPSFQGIAQQPGGKFVLTLPSPGFTASYRWHEVYDLDHCLDVCIANRCYLHCNNSNGLTGDYSYGPAFGGLSARVTVAFQYQGATSSYDVDVSDSSASVTGGANANIPAQSILQQEEVGCFSTHVSQATADAISSIDFSTPLKSVLSPQLKSIPESGQLTPDIRYDFGLGSSGLRFPNDQGIAIGITGNVTYKGIAYAGANPPTLPVPPPPTDAHHMVAYVSGYEINALHWAYFKAGLLDVTVNPSDLTDPNVLKVKTYVAAIAAFKPYEGDAMQAQIKPNKEPLSAFQTVYEFTTAIMNLLQQQLSPSTYNAIQGLSGNVYVDQAALGSDLSNLGVSGNDVVTIEKAAQSIGMAVSQDIEFKLVIKTGKSPEPELVFKVQRIDVLQNLALGLSPSATAQTLKYTFANASATATFVSTTIPRFDKKDFGDIIWPVAGEPRYDEALAAMGRTGVPLPIMSGFQFLFDKAQLSIQQGYVSILADVEFKG